MSITTDRPQSPAAPPELPPPGVSPVGPPPERRRRRTVGRLILGCLAVLVCSAGASAVFVLDQVHHLREALTQNKPLAIPSGTLAPAGWGDPQTLLLVGDDQRSLTGEFKYYSHAVLPHSNEMLLVRIDPSKPYISMMSIPRELMVTIYPRGQAPITTRFNYAYTAGGAPLLISTIKQVLGLEVNHVIVVTFARFKRAVDEMGCVYSTVDRRYYHVNVPGGEQYQEIDLQPGYQQMCGTQALQFVSYRHGDTSLVRDARDQSLLLDVKKQYGPTLSGNIGKFEHIFGQAVQTDSGLQSTTGLLNLIGTLISSSSRRVRQVQFQADLGPSDPRAIACACVTATPAQIASSVHAFLFGGSAVPQHATAAAANAVRNRKVIARLPLVSTGPPELAQALASAHGMPFPYEYPQVQDRAGSFIPVYLRDYSIHAPDHTAYPIYVAVFSAGQLGQYYDVQGTTWAQAPLLRNPEQQVRVAGRTYDLYYSGQHLQMAAWADHGAVYWVRNSLTDALANGELLAIAEQTHPVTPVAYAATTTSRTPRPRVTLRAATIPTPTSPPPSTDLKQTLGALAAALTLLALPLLAISLIRRRRELTELDAHLHGASERLSHLSTALNAAAVVLPSPAAVPRDYAPMNIYRSGRRTGRTGVAAGVSALAVTAAVGLGIFLATAGASTHTAARLHRPTSSAVVAPAVPVAVLNATSTTGVASRLAQQLRADHAKIAIIGNLAESLPTGLWILYSHGERAQATMLARLLIARSPRLAPIDTGAQAAAGSTAKIVVVIA